MSTESYQVPRVWQWQAGNGGKFSNINQPSAGSRFEKSLPRGKHPFQLYSLATPNGVKVTMLFEELLAAGFDTAQYDAYVIDIMELDQFGDEFVAINPNSKIPALLDCSSDTEVRVFESGSILLHLAEKFDAFIPFDSHKRTECLNWLFWQMGSAPILGGGFGHFYSYAPEPMQYPIDRFTMEVKRQLDVLDKHLSDNQYMVGDQYTIADIAIWPWYGALVLGQLYDAAEFLDVNNYTHVMRWATMIANRPATKRGKMVNKTWGDESEQLHERHNSEDFERNTQDRLRD